MSFTNAAIMVAFAGAGIVCLLAGLDDLGDFLLLIQNVTMQLLMVDVICYARKPYGKAVGVLGLLVFIWMQAIAVFMNISS